MIRAKSIIFGAVALAVAGSIAGPAVAEKRAALVIGNAAYHHVGLLTNPANDAAAVAALFKAAQFDVVDARPDLGISDLRRAVRDFAATAADADIAIVYFAGHGIEVDGANYLIPVDAKLAQDFDVEDETLSLDRVLKAIEPARRLRLVILDACRDNPFLKNMRRSVAARSIGRGLGRVEPTVSDTLVAFAAKAGSIALDGEGRHSPFTAAVVKHIAEPGLDIRLAFGRVRDEVLASTTRRQEPFVYGSLGGRTISIIPAPAAPAGTAQPTPIDLDAAARRDYELAERIDTKEAWDAFLERHPAGYHASLARAARGRLAAVAPPVLPVVPPKPIEPAVGVFPPPVGVQTLAPERERALKPKDTFKECDACPEMVVVPPGSFMMGSPESETARSSVEGPQRRVTFARPFAVGRLEITVDEFAAFVQETGHDAGSMCLTLEGEKWEERPGRSFRNPGFAQTGSHPAACLSWHDAKAYVAWLSSKTGKPYRLLTEAEWEYAARAGTTTSYSFGNDLSGLCRHGNVHDQTAVRRIADQPANSRIAIITRLGAAQCDDGYAYTAPAGSFAANGFALHDMEGNVWEWVEDCWNDHYRRAPTDGSAWLAGNCGRRAHRGGSWTSLAWRLRAAHRESGTTGDRRVDAGLRVARTLAQ